MIYKLLFEGYEFCDEYEDKHWQLVRINVLAIEIGVSLKLQELESSQVNNSDVRFFKNRNKTENA